MQGLLETLDVAYVGAGVTRLGGVPGQGALQAADVGRRRAAGATTSACAQERWRRARARGARGDRRAGAAGVRQARAPGLLGRDRQGRARPTRDRASALEQALRPRRARDRRGDGARASRSSAACSARCAPNARRRAAAFASEPGEIVFARRWYDFDAKYSPGGMELTDPGRDLSRPRARAGASSSRSRRSRHAGCEGLARVDFFVDGEQVLVNELNTMPGFTPTSVYAKLIAASGVAYARAGRPPLPRSALERARRSSAPTSH